MIVVDFSWMAGKNNHDHVRRPASGPASGPGVRLPAAGP